MGALGHAQMMLLASIFIISFL
uniref:Uncharacterized protein n=1 Tax=Rhizophora mucronata TaxID=61149 RepID=A0A2P2NBQ9_RHIMU